MKQNTHYKIIILFLLILTLFINFIAYKNTSYQYGSSFSLEFKLEPSDNINHLCHKLLIRYDENISIEHFKVDLKLRAWDKDKCQSSISINNWIIQKDLDPNGINDVYILKLDIKNLLNNSVAIKNFTKIECSTQLFDKKINVSEPYLQMIDPVIRFNPENDYEITVNKSGFYYVECKKMVNITTNVVYKSVFNILPKNMTKLIQEKMPFSDYVKENVKKLTIQVLFH